MDDSAGWRLGHRPALDGVRGIAVLLVVATHFDNGQVTLGGVMGVKVFFTLSGFLITTLLLEERERAGRISIGAFYVRRARRLLPALACVLLVFGTLAVAGLPLDITGGMAAAVVAYCSNWYLLATATGAHVQWGALGHTWSLAIEEQFYLVWPPLVILALRWGRRGVLVLASVLAGGSLAYWALTGRSTLDTGISAWCLLAGCVLAGLMNGRPTHLVPWWLTLPMLLAIPAAFTGWGTITHIGAPLVTALAIWTATQARVAWLEVRWLRWVGVRPYGLYLWHVPIAYLGYHVVGPSWWATSAVGICISFGLCALSWRYVERPFLRSAHAEPVERRVDDVRAISVHKHPDLVGRELR